MFDGQHYELYEEDPMVLVCVFAFLIFVSVFLVNMLIAQLTCAEYGGGGAVMGMNLHHSSYSASPSSPPVSGLNT